MDSPLLEKLHLPPNWRLYQTELIDWRKKFFAIPRPLAVLPTRATGEENAIGKTKTEKSTVSGEDDDKAKEKITNEKSHRDDRRDAREEIGDASENTDTENGGDKKAETPEREPSDAVEEESKQVTQAFPIQSKTH